MRSRIRGQGKGDAFPVAEVERKLAFRAWLAYYNLLGAYSAIVCSSRDRQGFPAPASTDEHRLVEKKKRLLYEEKILPLKESIKERIIREERILALKEHEILWGRTEK